LLIAFRSSVVAVVVVAEAASQVAVDVVASATAVVAGCARLCSGPED
jgi:hypothetical protein